MRGFVARLTTELNVNECQLGIFGAFEQWGTPPKTQWLDCEWRRYQPIDPLFELSIPKILSLGFLDLIGEYVEYTCLDLTQHVYDGGA